jgi:hypothetical protein
MVAGLRSIAKAMELPPEPNVRAPALDPTREGVGVKSPRATRHSIRGHNGPGSLAVMLFGERCWPKKQTVM